MYSKLKYRFLVLWIIAAFSLFCISCKSKEEALKQPAVQGRGLLPSINVRTEMSAVLAKRAFRTESNGTGARTLFEHEGKSFKVTVRELMLSPRTGPTVFQGLGPAVIEMRTEKGDLSVNHKPVPWRHGGMAVLPVDASVQLTNYTDRELVIRLYLLEAR